MAHVRKPAINGYRTDDENDVGRVWQRIMTGMDPSVISDPKRLQYLLCYSSIMYAPKRTSKSFVEYANARELGLNQLQQLKVNSSYGIRHLLRNGLHCEHEIKLGRLNKIFCSTWLSDNQIAFGTKCNKLMVLDLCTQKLYQIPSLQSSPYSHPPENPCGIHSLQINPSRTLLATGALNSNDVAVYSLPTLDPVCVGEGAHNDWIFDLAWIDDEFFVTGSRDTTLALWRVQDANPNPINYGHVPPLMVRPCRNAEKVRAILYSPRNSELVALSLNAFLHQWDVRTFKWKASHKLSYSQENVCLAQQAQRNMYAIGSKSYITFLDSGTFRSVYKVPSKCTGCSVRSLSFSDDLLTIGTGIGAVLFFDLRVLKYLDRTIPGKYCALKANRGWVHKDATYEQFFSHVDYTPAIYTHCYDSSGLRLFTAGGPLPAGLQGNYAGLWY